MPSTVSVVCSRLRARAWSAMASVNRVDINNPLSRLQLFELRRGGAARRVWLVGDDLAVLEADDPRAVLGDLRLVRDQHDCNASFVLQPLEDVHHLEARAA